MPHYLIDVREQDEYDDYQDVRDFGGIIDWPYDIEKH